MLISAKDSLLTIILLSSVLFAVIFVSVLLALKYKQYRSRPYLFACCLFLLQALGIGGILLISITDGKVEAPFNTVLRPGTLITGFITLIFLLLYINEIKRPGKLKLKTLLFHISPFIIASITLLLIHPKVLNSPGEIFENITCPDVWLRLIIVSFYFIYPIAAACQPYDWRQCLISKRTVIGLHILICLVCPAFVTGIMCGYFPSIIANYVIAILVDAKIAYIELKVRIPAKAKPLQNNKTDQKPKESSSPKQTGESIFDDPEIWSNPNMTVTELAKTMGTNRTYLLDKIKSLGYSSYSDMINRKRVGYICEKLSSGQDVNIISLMFEAGFRSRSTASREFKRITGYTPSEYQESILSA